MFSHLRQKSNETVLAPSPPVTTPPPPASSHNEGTRSSPHIQASQDGDSDGGNKTWTNLFEGTCLASKGKKLGFVSPILKDGKAVASLQQCEIDKMNAKWEVALIMFVVGYTPTIASITRFIDR